MHNFSHIYIEKSILEHSNTLNILKKYPNAKIVILKDYKNFFNPSNQNFQVQKSSPKLILAQKKDNFLYTGSYLTGNNGYKQFYYNSLILNCVYNCSYCYLQGMYNSANIVIFVNEEDFFRETSLLLEKDSLYLCISYDTDLLAFESLMPYASKWIEFSRNKKDLLIEIRTKSSSYKLISHLKPSDGIILAWTVSPEKVIKEYEIGTPTLNRRLDSISAAINDGWKVRLCIEPILCIKDWKLHYAELINKIFNRVNGENIFDCHIGTFRINSDYLKKIKKIRSDSDILYFPFKSKEKVSSYPENIRNEMKEYIKNNLSKNIALDKIYYIEEK